MNDSKNNQKVEILYEDKDFLAVTKPYGMIVNNADTSRHEFTLQDWVGERIMNHELRITNDEGSEFENRGGIVHRLDKETSGVLLIAKNRESFEGLQIQFKERTTEKSYIALCHGEFPEEANISVPVGRLPWNKKRFGVMPEGREASTDFELVQTYKDPDDNKQKLSLVRAFPKTGRTHQIRIHLQYSGHSIYADLFYAGRKTARRDRRRLGRHFLHAEKITFMHPSTKEKMSIESHLPQDLSEFLNTLEKVDQSN